MHIKWLLIWDSEQKIILLICKSNVCLDTVNKLCWLVTYRGALCTPQKLYLKSTSFARKGKNTREH